MLPSAETGRSFLSLRYTRTCNTVCPNHGRILELQTLDRSCNEGHLSTRKKAVSSTLCAPLLHPRHAPYIQQSSVTNRNMQALWKGNSRLRRSSKQDECSGGELDGFLDRYISKSSRKIQSPPRCQRTEVDDSGTSHSHLDTALRHRFGSLWRRRVDLSGGGEASPKLDWGRAS